MEKIKNIIFDLGNVLFDIDNEKTYAAFQHLGIENFKQRFTLAKMDNLFEDLETGKISDSDFYKAIQKYSEKEIGFSDITNAWNALLIDFRWDSLKHLVALAKHYQLYLLSNTNSIHKEHFLKIFNQKNFNQNFEDYFTKAYYSHLIGLRKPNKDIYEFVLKDAGLDANATLFIDDLENNILAANSLGIKTHLLLPGEKIENLLAIPTS